MNRNREVLQLLIHNYVDTIHTYKLFTNQTHITKFISYQIFKQISYYQFQLKIIATRSNNKLLLYLLKSE